MANERFTKVLASSLACSILLVNQCYPTSAASKRGKASKRDEANVSAPAGTGKAAGDAEQKAVETAEAKPAKKVMATSYSLGGTERYLTMLSTDKPIYRAGDKLYLRGVMLNAANKQPLPPNSLLRPQAVLEIKGPKGEVVGRGQPDLIDSVWSFPWIVPAGANGGEYTAYIAFPGSPIAPAERKFDVRAYRNSRLKSQIVFVRDGYAPGEKVSAVLDVKRAEGGFPVGAKVAVTATIDGVAVSGESGTVDDKGLCKVSFDLPKDISRGEGTLALVIADGGVVETATKTIPILLKTIDLTMYPEGGDLLAGHKNRVYLEALQTNGKPADLRGKIMLSGLSEGEAPQVVADVATEHEGRGRFEFTPQLGRKYYLAVSQPSGISKTFPLPDAKAKGAVITTDKDVFEKEQPIVLFTDSSESAYKVSLYKREVNIADYKVDLQNKPSSEMQRVQFTLPDNIDGVLTATIWGVNGEPLAERLIFRETSSPINIEVKPTKASHIPGETAELTVKATDANGQPISTVVGLTVTDETVLEMIDKREQAPSLPVMFYLEPEVRNLADAHVYLDSKNPKAPLATDLLLGTQGWRRFALLNPTVFVEKHGNRGRRVLGGVNGPAGGITGSRQDSLGQLATLNSVDRYTFFPSPTDRQPLLIPEEIGRVEGPRDSNLFQVEPTVLDERHYSTGRAERHQKTSPTLPEGAPIPDSDGAVNQRLIGSRIGEMRMHGYNLQAHQQASYVRQYSHNVRPNRQPNDRKDFTETLFWHAGLRTDSKTGEAKVRFALSDNVTTFRVNADAFSESGGIGATSIGLQSQQPFYTEAKLPLEVTAGDKILVPVNFVNTTSGALDSPVATIDVKGGMSQSSFKKFDTALGAGERSRLIESITVGDKIGDSTITVSTKAGAYHDKVTRQLKVTSNGFPVEQSYAGTLPANQSATKSISVPNFVPGSLTVKAVAYPSPLGNLTEALERLIQDPNGCFEQTSSTSYPLTMAQQYFLTHPAVDTKFIEKSRAKLDDGYKKLVSFWCPDRGYEWFGANPGHEALTAFGLMHFMDMKKVREVDQDMVETTRAWLMKQKDGQGGFTRKQRSLHTWVEGKDCSNSYIVWALLECGQPAGTLKDEIAWVKKEAQTSTNSYVVALAANALYLAGDKDGAKLLMERLVSKQKPDGSIDGITQSIVGSGGESLTIEGTSLATLAWLREPKYAGNVDKSIRFLADSCKAGRYGSTQATVLALRSILAYDKTLSQKREFGNIAVFVDDKQVGEPVAFDDTVEGTLVFPDLSEVLTAGEHKLELRMKGGNNMPYSIALNYNALTPQSSQECPLEVSVKMSESKLAEGEAAEALVAVSNTSKTLVPNPVAIIGIPGGMEVRHDQLKELVKKGKIDAYEVRGREVVLYWRGMAANAAIEVPVSLIAAVPGTYTAPANRAYLYYTDEHKCWTDGAKVEITPKVQVATKPM